MDYPKLIKEYRQKTFITQQELAGKLGVSFVTINRWENGHFEPTMKMKRKLNKRFINAGMVVENE